MSTVKSILITGATGNQGGAVLRQLATHSLSSQFDLLAVTRNATSPAARKITESYPNVLVVQGDLNDTPALFKSAQTALKTAGKADKIWGVYSVQASFGSSPANPIENEIRQGKALIDEALKNSVAHFVYSSVDRGGNEKSFNNATDVPHFASKNEIEQHLLKQAGARGEKMGWTILRPTAFMDNLAPGFPGKVFLTALRDTLKGKPLQWVAVDDIGRFAAKAFQDPQAWNARAEALAGDELTFDEMDASFRKATGQGAPSTFGFLGSAFKLALKEPTLMLNFFRDVGYGADIAKLRQEEPRLSTVETWLKEKSTFPKKN